MLNLFKCKKIIVKACEEKICNHFIFLFQDIRLRHNDNLPINYFIHILMTYITLKHTCV